MVLCCKDPNRCQSTGLHPRPASPPRKRHCAARVQSLSCMPKYSLGPLTLHSGACEQAGLVPLATLMLHLEPVDGAKLKAMQRAASEHLKQLVGRIGYRDLSSSENAEPSGAQVGPHSFISVLFFWDYLKSWSCTGLPCQQPTTKG